MMRPAGNPEAAALLRNGIEERLVAPLAAWVGGPDAAERAALVVALLSGVAVMADVLGVRALRDRPETVERLLAELTSLLVSGQATGPGETGGE